MDRWKLLTHPIERDRRIPPDVRDRIDATSTEETKMNEHKHGHDPIHDPILPLIALLRPYLLKIQTGTPAGTVYTAAEVSRILYIATGNISTNPVPPAAPPDPLPTLPGAG